MDNTKDPKRQPKKKVGVVDQHKLLVIIALHDRLEPAFKKVGTVIIDGIDKATGCCSYSIDTIAAKAGVDRKTAQRAVKELDKLKLIERRERVIPLPLRRSSAHRDRNLSNEYWPNLDLVRKVGNDQPAVEASPAEAPISAPPSASNVIPMPSPKPASTNRPELAQATLHQVTFPELKPTDFPKMERVLPSGPMFGAICDAASGLSREEIIAAVVTFDKNVDWNWNRGEVNRKLLAKLKDLSAKKAA